MCLSLSSSCPDPAEPWLYGVLAVRYCYFIHRCACAEVSVLFPVISAPCCAAEGAEWSMCSQPVGSTVLIQSNGPQNVMGARHGAFTLLSWARGRPGTHITHQNDVRSCGSREEPCITWGVGRSLGGRGGCLSKERLPRPWPARDQAGDRQPEGTI